MPMQMLVPSLAAVSSLGLAFAALAARPRLRLQWLFALGMAAFAAEAMCAFMLLTISDYDSQARVWLNAMLVVGLLSLLPWTFFVAMLADLQVPLLPRAWQIGAGVGFAVAAGAAIAVTLYPAFTIGSGGWDVTGARLNATGRAGTIVELLLTVGILVGLESCLRTARGDNRRRVKYLVLGLGGIFLIRFYALSQMLLFQGIVPLHLKMTCATLFVGNLLLALPITRDQLRGVRMTVSRQMLYRSAMIGVLGVYLFTVAALGSLLTYLAIPEETFWGSVVVFVSALALGAILLSDRLRWRLQRFITLNFYRSRYDYRQQWVAFTKRMSSLLTAEEIARELLDGVTETIGASTGAVYLAEVGDARYRLCGHVGDAAYAAVVDRASPLLTWLGAQEAPARPPAEIVASTLPVQLTSVVVAPLRWRASMIGLIVLGPERSGADYTVDDSVFLATVAEQAAGTMVTARLSESMAQAREMETFDKVTATVVHDIKNSVSALALLSRNALKNFDDPEFQRDTMTTLSRTVERMRRLLTRLSSPMAEAPTTLAEPVDLSRLVLEATTALATESRIRLVRDLGPTRKVPGDRDALLRVIENLVTNAAEAIEGDGTIAITLAEAEGRALLTVSDTGCGISEDFMQRHLFSPMRSTKKGGWGIGLYHTKQIIEHHHGTITVDSVEGHGTTFTVTLPIWAEPDGPARPTERDANVWETVR
jgi:putative PEP-CTERM system histidine kinase